MSEELLRVELAELLKTVRLKRNNGVVIEAAQLEAIRDCCEEVRRTDPAAGEALFQFFNLAGRLTENTFPVKVGFSLTLKR